MNVPKLRFKEFSGKWEEKKLKEISDLTDGTHSTPIYKNNGIPFWSVETITTNAPVKYISLEEHQKLIKRCKPEINDILITRISSGINSLGVPKIVNWKEDFSIYVSVGLIKSSSVFNSYYLKNYIESPNYKREFLSKSLLTATPKKINMNDLGETNIKLPSLNEQEKIGYFFEFINKKIQLQQEKIDLLQAQKKGYMQKIFKQELKFKNGDGRENPKWENKQLGELCDINTGNKDTQNKKDDGKYPFFVRSQTVERIDTYSFDGEAILTAGDGVGVGKVFHYINGKFDYHQRVYSLSKFKNSDGKYIYYYFSMYFMKEAKKYNAKTSVDSVRREMITKMQIPTPCLKEQRKISSFLSNIDKLVEKEQQKLDVLKEQKKAFMQQMFI